MGSGRHWWKFRRISVDQRRCQFGHPLDLHVAALEQPLVVLLEQHGADQAGDAGLIGEDADDVGSPLDLLVETFERIGNGMKIAVPARLAGIGWFPAYGATIRDEGHREHAEWAG